MTRLFVYGTLLLPEVQRKVIGREVPVTPGSLRHYKKESITIDDNSYPVAVPARSSHIDGGVIDVTNDEILRIDDYETDAYHRVETELSDGTNAWIYTRSRSEVFSSMSDA